MTKILLSAIAATLFTAGAAIAQTAAPSTPQVSPAPSTSPATPMAPAGLSLTEQEAKAWVDKAVYSSEGTKLGEVAAIARDPSGKVTELHADIGGFLGMGETRIRLTPAQFKLGKDRVDLTVTADQAKTMPKIVK